MIWLIAAAVLIVLAAVWLRDWLEGENLLLDLWDDWRIRRADIHQLDAQCARNAERSDVVISLTTIPSRLPHIGNTLKSLLRQSRAPREIRLNIPPFSRRENTAYVVPDWLKALRSVRVVPCDDYGPATKFIPTLLSESADRLVLVVDDDRIYPKRLLADLEQAARANPDAAFGTCGWVVPKDMVDRPTNFSNLFPRPPAPIMSTKVRRQRPVDILKGVSGYVVRPRFFDLTRLPDYTDAPQEAFFVDDVWLSGLCQVPKFVVPTRRTNFHPRKLADFYRTTSLGRMDSDKRKNTVMLQYFGADCWRVGGPRNLA